MRPTFLILGAQRSGTTSLYQYLTQHPRIRRPSHKEIHFFDLAFEKGPKWYARNFPLRSILPSITGEASPYYLFHPHCPQRVYSLFPRIKMLVLLRNPVLRAYSHWRHERKLACESLGFEAAIHAEEQRLAGEEEKILSQPSYYSFAHQHFTYLSRGVYWRQLERWFARFDRRQFLVIKSEDLYENPRGTVDEALRFLELPPVKLLSYDVFNASKAGANEMPAEIKKWLESYFAVHNERLASLVNIQWP